MSSISSEFLVQETSSLYISVNCEVAVFALIIYDWLLSLDEEVALFWNWGDKPSLAVIIYILSRYLPMIDCATSIISIFPISMASCRAVLWCQITVQAFELVVPAVFSAVRVYALSGATWLPAIVTLLLSLVPTAINAYNVANWEVVENLPSPFNCSAVFTGPVELSYRLSIIGRGVIIAADALVVIFTWRHTYISYRTQKSIQSGLSFTYSIFYHGNLYFIVMALTYTAHMILSALSAKLTFVAGNYANFFVVPFTSILVCHFLLNLHRIRRGPPSETTLSFVDVRFAVPSGQRRTLPEFISSLGDPVVLSIVDRDSVEMEDDAEHEHEQRAADLDDGVDEGSV